MPAPVVPLLSPVRRFFPAGGRLPDDVWRARHGGILVLLWAHVPVIPLFALARGYRPWHALLEGMIVPSVATAATVRSIPPRVRTALASLGLLLSSAVLVHLSGGVIEMHFHFFVMVAAVALYQDWVPFLAAIAFVFVHHGLLGALDANGVYNHAAAWENPWKWAGIHALFITGISATCLVTWRLNERVLGERVRAEDQLRAESHIVETLHSIGQTLAAELDTQRVVQTVTDAATQVTGAAFGAFFYNVVEGGERYTLYTLSGAPVEAFAKFGLPRNTPLFGPTFRGEGVVRLDDVTADPRYGKNAPHRGMPEGHLPVRSYLAVPVRSRTGEVAGGLFFGHPQPARFTEDDERTVVGIAAQAAVALDNARLYESERAARAAAEEARDALALLTDASRSLASSLELDEVLRDFAGVVAAAIGERCAVHVVDGAQADLSLIVSMGSPDHRGEDAAVIAAMAGRETRVVHDGDADAISMVVAPLIGRHRTLGALAVSSPGAERPISAADVAVVEELARRAAIAIENVQLYQRERTVAHTLQHSLLPARLPQLPGIATAARYLAGADVEVGGDWYDVIPLPGGQLAFTMGDVVGRGESAASLMGQLRNAVRAYALDGKAPAEIAGCVNRLLLEAGPENMATMVHGVLDPESARITFVNAGHPPPLIVSPDGTTAFCEGSGVPLGATVTAWYTEMPVEFPAGSTMVLYTDGVVEVRGEALEQGLDRLRVAVEDADTDNVDVLCGRVIEVALGARRVKDDAALLAVRLLPMGSRVQLRLPSDPAVLAPLRASLRRWLRERGASEQEVYELLVAAGEACSNAIRHAHGPKGSSFEFGAALDDEGTVELVVRDHGKWRAPRKTDGGRGITIIESLVDDAHIDSGPGGTAVTMTRRLEAMAT